MTLEERLSFMPPEEILYIGTTYGGGFFYIGPAKDAYESVKTIGDKTKDMKKIEDMMDKDVTAIKRMTRERDIKARKEHLQRLAERYVELDAKNNLFIHRQVVEEYPRRFEPPFGTILRVEGILNGGFWFLEEYMSGKVEYEGA